MVHRLTLMPISFPAASVVCRLLLKPHLRVILPSLTSNRLVVPFFVYLQYVPQERAGGGRSDCCYCCTFLGLPRYLHFFYSWGCPATTYGTVVKHGSLRNQQKTQKTSAMIRFTMLCYALGHPWLAFGVFWLILGTI